MSVLQMSFFGPGRVMLSPDVEAKIQSRKEFGLLAYLAVEHKRAHSRESILGLFWPELGEDQARNNMRVALARLRKTIDHATNPLILSDRRTVQFNSNALQPNGTAWLDVAEMRRLLAQVDSHKHDDPTQCPTCLAHMIKATELYTDEFLAGFSLSSCEAFDHWLLTERERLQRQVMELLPKVEATHILSEDWAAAEKIVRHRLSLDSTDEDAHRMLMRVLAVSGVRNAALSHYDVFVRMLDDELGVPPSEETVALAEMIREGNLKFEIDDLRGSSGNELNSTEASAIVKPFEILARLDPLPDQTLFGVDKAMDTVGQAINAADRSWLISVEGIGGLGKTTLANALVKKMVKAEAEERAKTEVAYQDVAWVSAKQEEYLPDRGVQSTGKPALDQESLMDQLLAQLADGPYPTGSSQEKRLALTQILQEKTSLVVVDNLETAIDYEALLPLLRHLANPSKFLITSRMSLSGQGDVFCYGLSELMAEDALAFLRHEAENRGMGALASATDEQLTTIYETVGGNPLALKLVLGQIQFLPLNQVLANLRQADTEHTDQLYTYIYWQAWQMLDAPSRHLLLCLPIVANATFDQLADISQLAATNLRNALMDLRNLSLVEVGGDLSQVRYRLHRLTETFLMHEVVKWQEVAALQKGMDAKMQGDGGAEEANYFIQRVLYMVQQWNESEAVHDVDVSILDHEFESVVKAILLGLELELGWRTVKPLIIAFTPFMERRGHWHTWHSILERAIDAANRGADLDGEITLTALLARLCQRESRPNDVVYNYRRVIRMARRSSNRFEEARACSNLGFAFIERGQWWRSEVLSRHALEVFEELGSDHGKAHTHNHLGVLFTRQSQWDAAESHLRTACKIWEKNQDNHSLINGHMNLGLLYVETRNPEQAIEQLSKAYHVAEIVGEKSSIARIWNNMAAAYQLKLDWNNAKLYAHKAEELFRKNVDYVGLASVWRNLGLIAFGNQCHDLARTYLEKSLETHKSLKNLVGIRSVQEDLERIVA